MENVKKITIYAPIDCDVYPVEKIEDKTIASKALGDGVFIVPKGKIHKFYSIFEKASIALVADTKHAFFIKHEKGPLCLMHIGLETVSLSGKPFDVKVKIGDEVTLKSEIVNVDFDLIKSKKISLSTPILFDESQCRGFKFEAIKNIKSAKRGEPIGYLVPAKEKEAEEARIEQENHKNKFYDAASKIYDLVGQVQNFQGYANCMTRFRFIINNKEIVKIDEIKKIPIVRGINWNGNELQIIIGGDVIKVRDQFQNFLENNKIPDPNNIGAGSGQSSNSKTFPTAKKGFREKVLAPIISCVTPLLPILLASGLLKGIYAILSIAEPDIFLKSWSTINLNSTDQIGPFILYVMGDVGISFMAFGLFLTISKYLKEDIISASFVALLMMFPTLYGIFSEHKEWIIAKGFTLDRQEINYSIGLYQNSLFVAAAGAILFHVTNKWVKSWMPGLVDIIFRMAIVVVITTIGIFFIIGPVVTFFQAILSIIIRFIGNIPYGFGIGIFAMLWQPLVLTGAHVPVALILQNDFQYTHIASALYFALTLPSFGQFGAGLGVTCITKDANVRRTGIGGVVPAFLGITEPIIYSINLVRVKPFIWACVASFFGGWFAGLSGVGYYTISGLGIVSIPALITTPGWGAPTNIFTNQINNTTWNIIYGIISFAIATGLGFLFVALFVKERPNEFKQTKKINRYLEKIFILKSYYCNNEKITNKLNNYSKSGREYLLKWYIRFLLIKFNILYTFTFNKNQKNNQNKIYFMKNNEKFNSDFLKLRINSNNITNLVNDEFIKKTKEYEKEVIKCNTIKSDMDVLSEKLDNKVDKLQTKLDILNSKKDNKSKLKKIDFKINSLLDQLKTNNSSSIQLKTKNSSSIQLKINKLNAKRQKIVNDNKIDNKIAKINKKLEFKDIRNSISKLEQEREKTCKNYEILKTNIQSVIDKYIETISNLLNDVSKEVNDDNLVKIENKYFNAINSVDICYGLEDKKEYNYTNKEILKVL